MFGPNFNDWTLVSLSPLPLWALVLLGSIIALVVTWVLFGYRRARNRKLLITLRCLSALMILAFLTEPALQGRVVRKARNRLALVLDRSASMGIRDRHGERRWDLLLDELTSDSSAIDSLAADHTVELYDLETSIQQPDHQDRLEAASTDLVGALERVVSEPHPAPLAAIVLFSDGADNVNLSPENGHPLNDRATEKLARLGVPVNTVLVASRDPYRDLAIVDVAADQFAFVQNTLAIDVQITASGIGRMSVPVTLRRAENAVATTEALVTSGQVTPVRMEIKPDAIGSFIYTVEIPPVEGETLNDNNRRSFVLQVVRDKIRVLQVAGRPSWDERFLRQHLKENPNVDLVSFFILRAPTDMPAAQESELSLIPFPVDTLFTTKLSSFDVVVFQNFDYRPYNMAQYLPNIRNAIEQGLGFVMIGGDQSLGSLAYVQTPLADVLPLLPRESGLTYVDAQPRLTTIGRKHPVTDLGRGTVSNETVWRQLPPWPTVNSGISVAPGGISLVQVTEVRGPDGAPSPIIAVKDTGQGRVMAIATDSMWRWRFADIEDGGSAERAYHRFWSNALHWLVRDPSHSRVRVLPKKREFDTKTPAQVTITVRGKDYQPVPGAALNVELTESGSDAVRASHATTAANGVAEHELGLLPPGSYEVTTTATLDGQPLGSGAGVFLVSSATAELSDAAPRPQILETIASATGGHELSLDSSLWRHLKMSSPTVLEIERKKNIELWDNGWTLVMALFFLSLEWAIRRRHGHV